MYMPQVLLNALKEKHPRNEATFQRCFIPMLEEAMGIDNKLSKENLISSLCQ
jgi:hypothetical protein